MADGNTISDLVEELCLALRPLQVALSSPDRFVAFMRRLGWDVSAPFGPLSDLGSQSLDVFQMGQGGIDLSQLPAAIGKWSSWSDAIGNLGNVSSAVLPPTIDAGEFKNEFPRQILDTLIAEHLLGNHPTLGALLALGGIIQIDAVPAAGKRLEYIRYRVNWAGIADLPRDPLSTVKSTYAWGQPNFKSLALLSNLYRLGNALGLTVYPRAPDDAVAVFLRDGATSTSEEHDFALRWELVGSSVGPAYVTAGVDWYPLPPTSAPGGIALLPYATGLAEGGFALTQDLELELKAAFDLEGGAAIVVRPGLGVDLKIDLASGAAASSAELSAALAYAASDGSASVLVGGADSSRVEVRSLAFALGARMRSGVRSAFARVEARQAALVIKLGSDADGFLGTLMPAELRAAADVAVTLDSAAGLQFEGGGGLEIQLPVHIKLGPIEVMAAQIAIKPQSKVIPVEVGGTLKGSLGPIQAVVENVGLRLNIAFPDGGGNLGPLDVSLGFKPPNGVGLQIDAGVVKGGGYLFFDFDREEYAGALELTISDFLSLKAIGLVTTRMPDGSKGFSLLVIITAEFSPGLQLGYGFTLIGVGGLLGLNRTVVLDALALGVRTGAVNGIMFPVDPVANAPRIISDLRTIFPPKQDVFLIGPMAKLGWGTPTLVSLALGVIIEIPGNVAILGVLKVALPTEEAALIKLQVNFIGAIEFDKKRGWFFAALFESRVLFITLEGEMGMLIALGDDANFVLSVGGFHPRFSPPPLPFPSPRRISFDIVNTPTYRIRVEGYFAVTTNTAQFGARAELYFGFSVISVEGHIAFDALMRFSPFYFIVEISAGVSLKAFGVGVFSIDLEFTLEGTTPWHARGRGSISLLFFSISADFDVTWGESRDTTLPPIQVVPLITAEIQNIANWRTLPPVGSNLLVSLRKLDLPDDSLVLHPLGTLEVSQRAMPLGIQLDKIGAQKPSDANRVALKAKPGGLAKKRDATNSFAPAQFKDMNDAQKLSARAFEAMPSGLQLGVDGNEWTTSAVVKRVVRYEVTTIDTNYRRFVRRFRAFAGSLFNHFLKGNATALSALSSKRKHDLQPFADKVKFQGDAFVVAHASDNRAFAADSTFASEAAAQDYLQRTAANDPNLGQSLHVIPASELNAA